MPINYDSNCTVNCECFLHSSLISSWWGNLPFFYRRENNYCVKKFAVKIHLMLFLMQLMHFCIHINNKFTWNLHFNPRKVPAFMFMVYVFTNYALINDEMDSRWFFASLVHCAILVFLLQLNFPLKVEAAQLVFSFCFETWNSQLMFIIALTVKSGRSIISMQNLMGYGISSFKVQRPN